MIYFIVDFRNMYRLMFSILLFAGAVQVQVQRTADTFHLYFDLNVSSMNKNTEHKIDILIFNDKILDGAAIKLIGYADYLGSEAYNKNLSMERARNVRNYLVKSGIKTSDIKLCLGEGKIDRPEMTDKEGYPEDRRVDIVVNNDVEHPITSAGKRHKPSEGSTANSGSLSTNYKRSRDSVPDSHELGSVQAGQIFTLRNVYFYYGRHVIKPESYTVLQKLLKALKDNPTVRISIEGHVCCIQPGIPDALDVDTDEPVLSYNRAKAIYQYLVDKGINADRLEYRGFGKSRPIVPFEQTEEDAEMNRRVEVRVLSK